MPKAQAPTRARPPRHLGKLPVNTQLGAYYNVAHPDDGANWQLRVQVQFMFPK